MKAQGDPTAESDDGVTGDVSLGESGGGLHRFAVDGDGQILAESGDLDASIEQGKFEGGLSAQEGITERARRVGEGGEVGVVP